MIEPNDITIWMHVDGRSKYQIVKGIDFCEQVVVAINRDPNRRPEVKYHKIRNWCKVVDYSVPIKHKSYHGSCEFNLITGWRPMERGKS